jgi:hypothetical protein
VWQAYVIEATQAKLAGLREVWREAAGVVARIRAYGDPGAGQRAACHEREYLREPEPKRSLVAWLFAPLWLAAFVVWSMYWQLRVAVEGVPQASLRLAGIRLRRQMLGRLVAPVTSHRA